MSDLESRLRRMLKQRANDITAAPEWTAPPVRRARNLVVWLAAAAVVLLVIGIGVAVALTRRSAAPRPAGPHPTATAPTTPRPAPSTAAALQPLRCLATTLPVGWQQQLAAHTVSVPGKRLQPVAVDDRGDVLADESAAVATPPSHSLVLITRAGAVRPLYDLAPPASWDGDRIASVSTSGDWVAFALLVQAVSGGQGPAAIELVNLGTGAIRTLRDTTPDDATIVLGPVVFDGGVFWTLVQAGQGLMTGSVYRHDIATGRTSVVDSGPVTAPTVVGDGLYWSKGDAVVTYRRATLPPTYHVLPYGKNRPLFTDGRTDVWNEFDINGDQRLPAWRDGMSTPAVLVGPQQGGDADGVTGRLVWFAGATVLDTGTGAAAVLRRLPAGSPPAVVQGTTAAVPMPGGALAILDTDLLPALHC